MDTVTKEQAKASPSYQYMKELMATIIRTGIKDELMEIPIREVMEVPYPEYLPLSEAVRTKFLVIDALYSGSSFYTMVRESQTRTLDLMHDAYNELR